MQNTLILWKLRRQKKQMLLNYPLCLKLCGDALTPEQCRG